MSCRRSPGRSRSSAPACSARRSPWRAAGPGIEVVLARHLRRAPPHRLGLGRRTRRDGRTTDRSWSWSPCRPTTSATRSSPPCAARDAVVTDVGSVKAEPAPRRWPAGGARTASPATSAAHPMAGSERSGPAGRERRALRRPAVGGHAARRRTRPTRCALVEALALECGAAPVTMEPEEHDRAVARISHLPHLLAVLVAGRLGGGPGRAPGALRAGRPRRHPGRRRRPGAVAADRGRQRRGGARPARRGPRASSTRSARRSPAGDRDVVEELLARGVAGTAAIPGKHGGPVRPTRSVFVSVPDHPGELARLFARRRRESGSTSRTSTSTTTPAAPSASSSWWSPRRRAEHLLRRSRIPRLDDPPVELRAREYRRQPALTCRSPGRRRRRHLRVRGSPAPRAAWPTRLGLRYLDTGAMFRAMTWWLLREGVDVRDADAVAARCAEPEILSGTDPLGPAITVDGIDVVGRDPHRRGQRRGHPRSAPCPRCGPGCWSCSARSSVTAGSSSRAATSGPSCGRRPR